MQPLQQGFSTLSGAHACQKFPNSAASLDITGELRFSSFSTPMSQQVYADQSRGLRGLKSWRSWEGFEALWLEVKLGLTLASATLDAHSMECEGCETASQKWPPDIE
jgi:hypothetical protein